MLHPVIKTCSNCGKRFIEWEKRTRNPFADPCPLCAECKTAMGKKLLDRIIKK